MAIDIHFLSNPAILLLGIYLRERKIYVYKKACRSIFIDLIHNILKVKTIHINTIGPKSAPLIAPKIGPVPAIFKSSIKNAFHFGRGVISTPSGFLIAGVFCIYIGWIQ